ncbi:MAG TPA: hypothetical protein VK474_05045 [Chthoniobacterales bacterium]|nr:hypothetical protein [Chthoniobacterales bacterium]
MKQEIAHSRDRLARDLTGLRYELDIPLKLRKSFQRNAGVWVSAAVLTGVVFMARALPKKKVVYSTESKTRSRRNGEEQKKGLLQAGLAMGALRFAATLLRPVVVSFVTRKLGSYAGGDGRGRRW